MQLTWDDLIIKPATATEVEQWLAPWTGFVCGRVGLEFLSKFGTHFLRRPEGHVEMLDVFSGKLERVSETYDAFIADVNERWWQEGFLLSELVFHLHEHGKVPNRGECYALAPHPALGGPNPFAGDAIDPRFVMLMDVPVWQSICAQAVGGSGWSAVP